MSVFDLSRIADESFVNQIDYHPRLGSTNDQAINLLKNHRPNLPLLVLAENQVAGRGQGRARWIAKSGSLTFSLCIPCRRKISTLLPLATGLAVSQTIEQFKFGNDEASLNERSDYNQKVQLKWPNDVLVGGKKVAGILIENVTGKHAVTEPELPNTSSAPQDSCYVVGIGINANNDLKPLERSVRSSLNSPTQISTENSSPQQATAKEASSIQQIAPTSLRLVTGCEIELTDFLISLLNRLHATLQQLADSPDSIVEACQNKLIFLNRKIEVQRANGNSPDNQSNDNKLKGECVGLGNRGELLINTDGQVKEVFSGQITSFE